MTEEDGSTGTIKRESFGRLSDGREALLFTLTNKNGMELKLTDFGAAVVSIIAPELSDGRKDMVLGFDDVSGYEATGLYLGATIGRYAGQIKNGSFEIRGAKYDLYRNDHGNTLHGGEKGFDKRLFSAAISEKSNEVVFTYFSPDMEEGFPGNLSVSSGYTLTEDNKVIIRFQAKSDRDTVLNMTNHCYYNLDGHDSGNVMGHSLRICAENYLKVGEDCAPDGEILPVEGSPMDFRTAHAIGDYIEEED
ncbi:MAG: galactose mutarotase, partial [Lachnospiraceae bacterium]|nr:galactose mutarotase [Lachnospiraceae bacterium]